MKSMNFSASDLELCNQMRLKDIRLLEATVVSIWDASTKGNRRLRADLD